MSDSKQATMSTTTSGELARAWAERVRAGTFSPAVAGAALEDYTAVAAARAAEAELARLRGVPAPEA